MTDASTLTEQKTLERFNVGMDRVARDFGYGQTAAGLGITQSSLKPLTDHIKGRIDNLSELTEDDPEKQFLRVIRNLAPETVAFSAINEAINAVVVTKNALTTRLALGAGVAGELWAAGLLENDATLARRIEGAVRRKHGNLKYRKQAARSIAARMGFRAKHWTREELLRAGNILLGYLLTSLPEIFTFEPVDGEPGYLTITPGGMEVAERAVEEALRRNPVFVPTTEPPKPWTGWFEGGYWDERARFRAPVVRTYHKETVGAIRSAIRDGSMQPHLDALNHLQSVAWTINKPVLEVLKWAHETGLDIEGLPPKEDLPLPPKPEVWDDDSKRLWKYRAHKVKERNRSFNGNRILFKHDYETADLLTQSERFWTPLNCDWRGRVYSVCHFNFQRDDRVRALFLFADGQPIGEEGLKWLKVHVANCWGNDRIDKKPLAERIKWVDENVEIIREVASAPMNAVGKWSKAKTPFLFLAGCLELERALSVGLNFITTLPVSFDGSCSGLQHLAAMTRDEVTAKLVNLIPSATPQDVYESVAQAVTKSVQTDHAALAKIVSAFGIDRNLVKRNVMTYSYSSKKFGMSQQLMEDLMRPLEFKVLAGELKVHPFASPEDVTVNKETGKINERPPGTAASKYLASHIYDAIEALVRRPALAMAMLQKCARVLAHEGKPVTWTTPLGLPWINRYHAPVLKCLNLWLNDTRIRMNYAVGNKKEIDKDRAANGVAPNFVHALDATHLLMVALACSRENLTQLATVHDSFGCLAPQAARFNQIIREQFVELYEKHNVLKEVLDQSKHDLTVHNQQRLPEVPDYGSLNLNEVLNADYAFA